MQTEVELLDNTQIIQLQKLLKTDKFVEFMRPNKGICNPRGRTIVEIWTWVSRELGLTKEQFESFANLRDFEMGLYDMEIINLKKTDTGYLWFHNSWY